MTQTQTNWIIVIVAAVLGVVGLYAIGWGDTRIDLTNTVIALPILAIFGIVSLIAAIAILILVIGALGLGNKDYALGLPQGTVRAIIALSLVVIFVISMVYLYGDLAKPLAADVKVPQHAVDFANRVFDTVSTLLIAVVGFYFGSRTIAAARGETADAGLTIVNPTSPHKMAKDAPDPVRITVETTPKGEAILWDTPPKGDPDGSLTQTLPGTFDYTRGGDTSKIEDTVVLRFRLARHPDIAAELSIDGT